MILIRELGPNDYGLFVSMLSAAVLAAPFTDLGISPALTRDGARDPGIIRYYVKLVFTLKTVSTLLLWAMLTFIYYGSEDFNLDSYGILGFILVVAILGVPLIDHFHAVMTSVLQIEQRFDIFSKYRISMFAGVLLLFLLLPYIEENKLFYVGMVYFFATLTFVLFYVRKASNYLPDRKGVMPTRKSVMLSGLSFLGLVLSSLAYFRIDVIVLTIFGTIKQAGLYGAFYQGVLVFFIVSGVFFNVMFPSLYRGCGDTHMLRNLYSMILRFLNVLSACVAPIAVVNSEQIVNLVLGEKYAVEHELFKILVLFSALSFSAVSLNFLNVTDRIRQRFTIELLLHSLVATIGVFAVIHYSVLGMAVVAVTGYFIVGVIAMYILFQASIVDMSVVFRDFCKLCIVLLISSSLFFIDFNYWWMQAVLYVGVMLILLRFVGYWHTEDRSVVEKVQASIFKNGSTQNRVGKY